MKWILNLNSPEGIHYIKRMIYLEGKQNSYSFQEGKGCKKHTKLGSAGLLPAKWLQAYNNCTQFNYLVQSSKPTATPSN
jgi:hypothetical protein